MTLRDVHFPVNKKNPHFLEKDSSEKRGDHHGGKGSRKRNAGYRGACLALERQLADSRSFVHAEFPPPFFFRVLQVRYSGMNRGKDYARQCHDSAHAKNRVEEPEEIRILGDLDNAPHDFRYTLSGNASKTTTANHDIDARLSAHAPGLNADACLFQGKVSKSKGLSIKRRGKVNTASGSKLHPDNLFC
jgi:hypothetical protein